MRKYYDGESANELRWDLEAKGHYEVYYLTFNHVKSNAGFWIRYTLSSPDAIVGEPYAQMWFSYFNHDNPEKNFALKKNFPTDQLKAGVAPFKITIGENELRNGRATGSISGNGHEATWDLSFDPSDKVHFMVPRLFAERELGDTTALVPNLDVYFKGKVTIDGETLEFNGDPGCQTHLWGDKHAEKWCWGHCNSFAEDPSAVFEGLTVHLKRMGISFPPISMIAFRYMGREYNFVELNRVLLAGGSFSLGSWDFHATLGNIRFKGEIRCRNEDLVCAGYYDPDGERAFCNNTEVADCTIQIFKRNNFLASWKLIDTLHAKKTAHVEFAGRKRDPAVTKKIEEVE